MNSNDWQPHESPARTEYVVSLERKLAAAEKERDEAVRAALANSDACWRMEQEVIVRQRDEARAEVARLTAQLESITAENHSRAQREARSLEDWASLRAEIEMLRGVGCREAKAGEPESGPCGVCLRCAEERGAKWALDAAHKEVVWAVDQDRANINVRSLTALEVCDFARKYEP